MSVTNGNKNSIQVSREILAVAIQALQRDIEACDAVGNSTYEKMRVEEVRALDDLNMLMHDDHASDHAIEKTDTQKIIEQCVSATIRDQFALRAMGSMLVPGDAYDKHERRVVAEESYLMADAMMEARVQA